MKTQGTVPGRGQVREEPPAPPTPPPLPQSSGLRPCSPPRVGDSGVRVRGPTSNPRAFQPERSPPLPRPTAHARKPSRHGAAASRHARRRGRAPARSRDGRPAGRRPRSRDRPGHHPLRGLGRLAMFVVCRADVCGVPTDSGLAAPSFQATWAELLNESLPVPPSPEAAWVVGAAASPSEARAAHPQP